MDKLRSKHNLAVVSRNPHIPYKETIKRGVQQHSRFKRQSGGHGQFADITIEVKPLPRGTGHAYVFAEAAVVNQVRDKLVERGFPAERISPKAYWGRGRANASHGEPLK